MSIFMAVLWCWHLTLKNAGLVDLGWVAGFVILTALYFFQSGGSGVKKILLFWMVGLWAGRLFLNLLARFLKDQREDPRYQKIRSDWKTNQNFKFFFFFQFQGLLGVILSLPFFLVCSDTLGTLSWPDSVGFAIWLAGIFGEAAADMQLKKFKDNPYHRGMVCREGLWNYSRHPNYFFEWLVWVGYGVFALSSPMGWSSSTGAFQVLAWFRFTRWTMIRSPSRSWV